MPEPKLEAYAFPDTAKGVEVIIQNTGPEPKSFKPSSKLQVPIALLQAYPGRTFLSLSVCMRICYILWTDVYCFFLWNPNWPHLRMAGALLGTFQSCFWGDSNLGVRP